MSKSSLYGKFDTGINKREHAHEKSNKERLRNSQGKGITKKGPVVAYFISPVGVLNIFLIIMVVFYHEFFTMFLMFSFVACYFESLG